MNSNAVRAAVSTLLLLPIGAPGFVLLMQPLSVAGDFGSLGLVLFIVALWPVYCMSQALHECGHWAAAHFLGYRVDRVAFGRVQLVRRGGTLQIARNSEAPHWAVTAMPVDDSSLLKRFALLVVAGPMVNLALVIVLGGLSVMTGCVSASPPPGTTDEPHIPYVTPNGFGAAVLNTACLMNLTLGLCGLMPATLSGRVPSDGSILWTIAFGGREFRGILRVNAVLGASRAGIRPRDWPAESLALAIRDNEGTPLAASSFLYGYYAALDRGDPEAAGEWLMRAEDEVGKRDPIEIRRALWVELAYFAARYRNDPAAARSWVERVPFTEDASAAHRMSRHRAMAAVCLVEGDRAGATREAVSALALLPECDDPGGDTAEAEWIESLLVEACREIQSSPAAEA